MTTLAWAHPLFAVYLVYGLAFVLLGMVSLLHPGDSEDLPISRHSWLLGAFGLIHGGKEFFDAWVLATNVGGEGVAWTGAVFLLLSYVPLLEFARRAAVDAGREGGDAWVRLLSPWLYLPLAAAVLLLTAIAADRAAAFSAGARYFVGFPGAVLTGLMLRRAFDKNRLATHVLVIAFIAYGVVGGLIPAPVAEFPAVLPTQAAFLEATGVPVQLFRAACALAAMLSLSTLVHGAARATVARARETAAAVQDLATTLERRVDERTADLQKSQRQLNDAQRIARLGSWEFDNRKKKLTWSDEIYRMFEIDPELSPPSYSAYLDMIHPDEREMVDKAFFDSLENRTPFEIVHRLLLADGTVKWVHQRWETDFDADGEPVVSRGTVQDITELRQAEEALRESEGRLRSVMDNAADGIVTIDEAGAISSVNRAACRMFGYTVEELRGQNVSVLMPDPHRSEHDRHLGNDLTTGTARSLDAAPREMQAQRKNGSEFPVELAIARSQWDEHCIFVASIRDITERKEEQQKLQQSQKMEVIGQLAGGTAHDFNNLLAIIIGNLELLQAKLGEDDGRNTLIEMALRASFRGADLTQRLLAISRKQPLAPKPTDVNKCVLNTAALLRRTLGEDIEIQTVLGSGLWPAVVDETQLESAVLNLAINARDAMPGGGTLTIETRNRHLDPTYAERHSDVTPGPYVTITLSDTGHGMTAEVLERVYEPFFTTKEAGEGSGLGLSMVHGFAKQSGGDVTISSEPGQGTSVQLSLRKAGGMDEATRKPRMTDANAMPTGDETILVVEDDPDVRAFVVYALGALGYTVLEAKDGASALDLLEGITGISLLFTDTVLPGGMNGRELADEVQRRRPGVGVLLTSGYTANAIDHEAQSDAGKQLLAKPYTRKALASRIRAAIDGRPGNAAPVPRPATVPPAES